MAHIHQARNELQEKLDQAKTQRQQRHASISAGQKKERKRGIIIGCVFLVLCVISFILLIRNINIGLTVRGWVQTWLSNASDATFDAQWGGDWMDRLFGDSFIVRLLDGLIFLVLLIPKLLVGFLLGVLAIVMPSVARITLYLLPLLLGLFALFMMLGYVFWGDSEGAESDDEQIIRAGLEGEQAALDLMKKLGNNCHVFTNLKIPYDGGESETDLIVVSPAGVTVIEVKNYKGVITGDASDDNLTQTKTGRRGGSSDKTVQNPIKQVGTHVYRVAGYLRDQGIRTYVRNCVLFVSDEVVVNLTDYDDITVEKCPVFTRDTIRSLYDFVSSGKTVLNDTYLNRAVNALDGLVQRSFGKAAPAPASTPRSEAPRRAEPVTTATAPRRPEPPVTAPKQPPVVSHPRPEPPVIPSPAPSSRPNTNALIRDIEAGRAAPRRDHNDGDYISNEKFK